MSLSTDIAFVSALRSSTEILNLTDSRIYGTAIPVPDEDLENTPVPYIIVTFDGMTNNAECKDDEYEGEEDSVQIGLEITASTLASLHSLAELVRTTVREYMESGESPYTPIDYTFSTSGISYDASKPCYWINFTYSCMTQRDIDNE